jgi:hypothetical protein
VCSNLPLQQIWIVQFQLDFIVALTFGRQNDFALRSSAVICEGESPEPTSVVITPVAGCQ